MNNTYVINALPKCANGHKVLKKTVGYARVSTLYEEQNSSYDLQILELEKDIRANPDYQFLGVFKDKKSGTTTKYRDEFSLMIELARKKEIDLIITKSISRFARNLIDTITITRELRNIGVEVYFQKDNISTLDDKYDFVLSILAVHAEEESKNISQNNLWTVAKKKKNGENLTNRLYGYRILNGEYMIYDPEAKIINEIFNLYIEGNSYRAIIEFLHNNGVQSPAGNEYWYKSSLEAILRNEKYAGDMILGKFINSHGKKSLTLANLKR